MNYYKILNSIYYFNINVIDLCNFDLILYRKKNTNIIKFSCIFTLLNFFNPFIYLLFKLKTFFTCFFGIISLF